MSTVAADAILYAEDDPDDRLLAEMAHRDSGVEQPLVFVRDGDEAIEYLRATGPHVGRPSMPRPGLLLLDLNMPGRGGRETLTVIRTDRILRRLPVLILTTSSAATDIASSYDAGANSYIVKPSSFASLVRLFERVSDYWFHISTLPQEIAR